MLLFHYLTVIYDNVQLKFVNNLTSCMDNFASLVTKWPSGDLVLDKQVVLQSPVCIFNQQYNYGCCIKQNVYNFKCCEVSCVLHVFCLLSLVFIPTLKWFTFSFMLWLGQDPDHDLVGVPYRVCPPNLNNVIQLEYTWSWSRSWPSLLKSWSGSWPSPSKANMEPILGLT